jgi:broad specificity polyphosphatase/5'/3'-nucleotidase SurE
MRILVPNDDDIYSPGIALARAATRFGDVLVTGINLGPNLGNASSHSGTLAAAKQPVAGERK